MKYKQKKEKKINRNKSCVLENINKIVKPLARLTNENKILISGMKEGISLNRSHRH